MTTDEIYRIIAEEIRDGKQDVPTWTHAYADADGDESKTKARYIRLRLAQLKARAEAQPEGKGSQAMPPSPGIEAGDKPARSGLETLRDALAQQLATSGKPSLYGFLGLSARSDDGAIARAVRTMKEAETQGRALSAEEQYAIRTLGDPAARERYDRNLLDSLARIDPVPPADDPTGPEKSRSLVHVAAAVMLIAIAAYAGLGYYRESARKEADAMAAKAREAALQAERIESAARREAAAEAARVQAEAAERTSSLAAEREAARQQEVDLRNRQNEERRYLADQQRERYEKEREARAEQEKSRRAVMDAERELCTTARRNNNVGAVARWCK